MAASGFETYESFRDTMMETFETSFASGFATSGSEVDEFFEIKYPEEEIIEMKSNDGNNNVVTIKFATCVFKIAALFIKSCSVIVFFFVAFIKEKVQNMAYINGIIIIASKIL